MLQKCHQINIISSKLPSARVCSIVTLNLPLPPHPTTSSCAKIVPTTPDQKSHARTTGKCPATTNLGQSTRATATSGTEGADDFLQMANHVESHRCQSEHNTFRVRGRRCLNSPFTAASLSRPPTGFSVPWRKQRIRDTHGASASMNMCQIIPNSIKTRSASPSESRSSNPREGDWKIPATTSWDSQ